MTSPGGSGVDVGDDYVAARLSIDVPSEGIGQIRELTEGVERFHTAMEAATRSEADMSRYLDQMAEASKRAADAQANLTQQLQSYVQLQARAAGATNASGVPTGGAVNPFGGITAGAGGERQPAASDVYWQLNNHAAQSPREYMNMQAARGGVPSSVTLDPNSIASLAGAIAERERVVAKQATNGGGQAGGGGGGGGGGGHRSAAAPPDPFDQVSNRINQGVGLGGSVLSELGASSGIGFAGLALGGLNYARKKLQTRQDKSAKTNPTSESGDSSSGPDSNSEGGQAGEDPEGGTGGLSGLTKGLGIGGGALTAIIGAYSLVQKGGEMIQGLRNTAGQRGGAAGEGFDLQLKTRALAADPTISTDQARQVYQAMLSEGYANASGDQMQGPAGIKDFLTNNIKTFNLDVSQSVELLRIAGKGTQVSLGELTDTLGELKNASKDGWLSQQDYQKLVLNQTANLVAQGVDPHAALQTAQQSAYTFSDNPILAGTLSSVNGNTPQGQAWERLHGGPNGGPIDIPAGLNPTQIDRYLNQTGKGPEAKLEVLYGLAKQAQNNVPPGDRTGDHESAGWLNSTGWFYQRVNEIFPGSDYQSQHVTDELYDQFIWQHKTVKSIERDNHRKTLQTRVNNGEFNITDRKTGGFMGIGGTDFYSSTSLDRVIKSYGGGSTGAAQIEVLDKDGKATKLDLTNKEQVEKLNKGELRWRHKGDKDSKGHSLLDDNQPGLEPEKDKNGGGGKYDLTEDARKLLRFLPDNGNSGNSPNDDAANAGEGGASKNNPPFGDAQARAASMFGLFG